jgi:hypothetical protein
MACRRSSRTYLQGHAGRSDPCPRHQHGSGSCFPYFFQPAFLRDTRSARLPQPSSKRSTGGSRRRPRHSTGRLYATVSMDLVGGKQLRMCVEFCADIMQNLPLNQLESPAALTGTTTPHQRGVQSERWYGRERMAHIGGQHPIELATVTVCSNIVLALFNFCSRVRVHYALSSSLSAPHRTHRACRI